jgi:hypothetical protein
MDLKSLINGIHPIVRLSVSNVRLSPELGYWPAKFENLESLHQWLSSEAGEHYRYPGAESINVTLLDVLRHCDRPSARVMTILKTQTQLAS